MEWYGAFALMITLIWLYFEILRLLSKIPQQKLKKLSAVSCRLSAKTASTEGGKTGGSTALQEFH